MRKPNLFKHLGLAGLLPLLLTGCLQTRSGQKEQDEKVVLRKQLSSLQQNTADINARFQDVEDETRRLNGRYESLEKQIQIVAQKTDQTFAKNEARNKEIDVVYKEEFAKLNQQVAELKTQLAALQEEQKKTAQAQAEASAKAAQAAKEAAKDPFKAAEEKFEEKNWKEAILDYEKYRKANPKGKQFAAATYKIGVSFQELGLADEAKAFYEEVISRFPKSKEAGKANDRLKKLKK